MVDETLGVTPKVEFGVANRIVNREPYIGYKLNQHGFISKIQISNTKLEKIPNWVLELEGLQKLRLSSNKISSFPDQTCINRTLRDLWLDDNRLTIIPETIGRLVNLHRLYLDNNQIQIIPDSIGELKKLEELWLQSNQIFSLPKSFKFLTKLKKLDLSDNQIKEVPHELGSLRLLESFGLSSNKLSSIPDSFGELKCLRNLNLSSNLLLLVPDSIGEIKTLLTLGLSANNLSKIANSLGQLKGLKSLWLDNNHLVSLPKTLGGLENLELIWLGNNALLNVPDSLGRLNKLQYLRLNSNNLEQIPDSLGSLKKLKVLNLSSNQLSTVPESLGGLQSLQSLSLENNPLSPELLGALEQGIDTFFSFLNKLKTSAPPKFETKLIVVGEGEVGKSCLVDAIEGLDWKEHGSTHGIRISSFKLSTQNEQETVTFNAWDFGGQQVYKPTHQLFFSAPAIYLVVWKPREGPSQGFVEDWIELVLWREPGAKIIVVATHGGPLSRQPDINRQAIINRFGKDTILDFLHVDSKPNNHRERKGIDDLRAKIVEVALSLPQTKKNLPPEWQSLREKIQDLENPFFSLSEYFELSEQTGLTEQDPILFLQIYNEVGHLVWYQKESELKNWVILKPDWLAVAISFVLDDKETRDKNGIVSAKRLSLLWNNPDREPTERYDQKFHPLFRKLLEKYDLAYIIPDSSGQSDEGPLYLIAQFVQDMVPEKEKLLEVWPDSPVRGEKEKIQVCKIIADEDNYSARATGLFYRLIVRLHKYSLGREVYEKSIHWQRGLMLDLGYRGRAFLEQKGNDIHIRVRAVYPERIQDELTSEIEFLINKYWPGLQSRVMVPCISPCGKDKPGTGFFGLEALIKSKRDGRPEFPCSHCDSWQNIDLLLQNASHPTGISEDNLLRKLEEIDLKIEGAEWDRLSIYRLLEENIEKTEDLKPELVAIKEGLSRWDEAFTRLFRLYNDEGREGPRLFSLRAVEKSKFNPSTWVKTEFEVTLWCEHSRRPVPILAGDPTVGVIRMSLSKEWFKKAAPYMKGMLTILSIALPVLSSGVKLAIEEGVYKEIEDQLSFGKNLLDAGFKSGDRMLESGLMIKKDLLLSERGVNKLSGGALREFQVWLKEKDASYGGLVRVVNKRGEYLWVWHEFEGEYD